MGPGGGNEKSVPLIVWPHGGPHSAFANYCIMEASLFASLGKSEFADSTDFLVISHIVYPSAFL